MQKIALSILIVVELAVPAAPAQEVSLAQYANAEIEQVNPEIAEVQKDAVVVPRPRTSPVAIASCKGSYNLYLKIVYGQPLKRGREIFGTVEPYGEVWRTGANEATEFTTTKDIRIGSEILKAGTYTVFTVPDKEHWKVLFNSELEQWGTYTYDASKDVLTTEVPVIESQTLYEAFTITFNQTSTGADLVMAWDKTLIAVPLTFTK